MANKAFVIIGATRLNVEITIGNKDTTKIHLTITGGNGAKTNLRRDVDIARDDESHPVVIVQIN